MRRQYKIENLDCAHCAMEMEAASRKIEGVQFVSINFVSMKLTLEAEDNIFPTVFQKVKKACREVEPEAVIVEEGYRMSASQKTEVAQILLTVFLFAVAKILSGLEWFAEGTPLHLLIFLPAYLLGGFAVIRKAFSGIFHGRIFDENFLMTLATLGAFAVGEAGEGVMVMILYRIGEFFQGLAVAKSRRSISELMDIRPDSANLLVENEFQRVFPDKVAVGSLIVVNPGEKIPLDGEILEGESLLDTVALTGESIPRSVKAGDPVSAGCINMNGVLKIRTQKTFSESSVSKILALIENSAEGKSEAERFITRFARYYTPVVVILALCLAVIPPLFGQDPGLWIHKAITCLVISCPCALVISVPLTFFGGIGGAGKNGILIKGADSLEKLSRLDILAFDKTGTLTRGTFRVTAIHPEIISEDQLLELAATCEYYSNHPISLSLKAAFSREIDKGRIGRITEYAGEGIQAEVDGKEYYVGNEALMLHFGIPLTPCRCHDCKGTVVHVAEKGSYLGHILVADTLREDSLECIHSLRESGISRMLLVSGDQRDITESIAASLDIKEFYAPLLPEEKHGMICEIREKNPNRVLAFAGDGINDAPVLAEADLGIAMGGIGADAAIEAADVVLMDDKPSNIPLALQIAKKTLGIVWQNVILSVGIKLFVLIPNIFLGEESVPLALAVFADVGVCLLAILNSTRALHVRRKKSRSHK